MKFVVSQSIVRGFPQMPVPDLHPNTLPRDVAPDVASLTIVFVNCFFVGERNGSWVLVDTGLPMSAGRIRRCAEERFGRGPEAIILTHGHFDHTGAGLELAKFWRVPMYAHKLEMPYLTGRSNYPPNDPTIGGALAQMARFFPDHGHDFTGSIRELPEGGSVPGLPEWRWIHTPGHSPGHVSLFRERDGFLIAGDALATVNQDSLFAMLSQKPEFHRPPAPLTTDWSAAVRSVERLSELNPSYVVAGHGSPITGPEVASELRHFASVFRPPDRGRYASEPALADSLGVVAVPPPAPDRVRQVVAGVAIAAAAGATIFALVRPKKRQAPARAELASSTIKSWK